MDQEEYLPEEDEETLEKIKSKQNSFKNRLNRKRVSKFELDDIFLM